MKTKLAAFFAAAMFAGSFAISTAQAYDWTEFSQCMATCRQAYRECLQYSSDNTAWCEYIRRQCEIVNCGVLN